MNTALLDQIEEESIMSNIQRQHLSVFDHVCQLWNKSQPMPPCVWLLMLTLVVGLTTNISGYTRKEDLLTCRSDK